MSGRKRFLTTIFLALAPVLAAAAPIAKPQSLRKISLFFPNGARFRMEVAETQRQREIGLMFRKSLPRHSGMIFAFPERSPQAFWMKNTWISLDIVYLDSDKSITALYAGVKPSTSKTTDEEVARVWGMGQYVLELPVGTIMRQKLKIGQKFKFRLAVPRG